MDSNSIFEGKFNYISFFTYSSVRSTYACIQFTSDIIVLVVQDLELVLSLVL